MDLRGIALQLGNVGGLWSLFALSDFERHPLPFIERAVVIADDCRVVHEDVTTLIAADEAIPLGGIEPLHCALSHALPSFLRIRRRGSCWIRNAMRTANK